MKRLPRPLRRSVGLLALAFAIAGCKNEAPVAQLPPPPVSVSQPVVRDVIDYDLYEGHVAAVKRVEIRTKAKGYLTKVLFKDGDVVPSGKKLYEIDPRPYQATLDATLAQEKAADAALDFARSEYNRVKRLVAERAASREEMEVWTAKQQVARSDKLKAAAAIEQAKLDLEYTDVKAPFEGQLGKTLVNEGTLINSGGGDTQLTTIVSVGPAHVYFNVDERSLLRYRQDYKAKLTKNGDKEVPLRDLKIPMQVALEGEQGYPHAGVVEYADPKVDPGTGTVEVQGVVPNKSGLFQDGMRARVRVPVGDPHKAMLITERAIGNEQGRKFVWVVNKDDAVERRDVTLGRVIDGLQVVTGGLDKGDRVIVSGIQRVRDGITVKPKEVAMPDAAPPAAPKGKE